MGSLGRISRWLDRCLFRALRVALPFLSSRVVKIKVNWWVSGRESRNSSISRQHVAKPRPLAKLSVSQFRKPKQKAPYLFAPVTRTYVL